MGTTADVLAEIRADIDADHDALTEARTRLALVRDAGSSFYGALRTYQSGSLAVHTMNGPVSDGDGGLVVVSRQVVESAEGWGSDSGVVPVVIVEVDPAR